MKIAGWIAALLAAAGLAVAAARPAGAPALSGAPAVEARWLEAFKANDVEGIVACYAPDAVLWGPGEPEARGSEAIRASYAGMLADNVVRDAVIANPGHRDFGNFSAGWGNITITLAPKKGGAPIVMRGRFTEVVEKRGGEWLYVADHASADPEAPSAPAK